MGVVLFNHGNEDFKIAPGDRIAQLICEKIIYPELEEVDSLDNTDRGEGGFGSTGKDWDFCILSIKFYLIKIMSFLYIILKNIFSYWSWGFYIYHYAQVYIYHCDLYLCKRD